MAVRDVDGVAVHTPEGATLSPRAGRRIHLTLLLAWLLIGMPAGYLLRDSVPFLVAISIYAVVVGHWSGWSAERPSEVIES